MNFILISIFFVTNVYCLQSIIRLSEAQELSLFSSLKIVGPAQRHSNAISDDNFARKRVEKQTCDGGALSGDLPKLLNALKLGDFECVESVSAILASTIDSSSFGQLLAMTDSSESLTRRNAWRTIGNFCWSHKGSLGCRFFYNGGGLDFEPKDTSFSPQYRTSVHQKLLVKLKQETDTDALNDAVWIAITWFLTDYADLEAELRRVAFDNAADSSVRFRATSGVATFIGEGVRLNTRLPSQADLQWALEGLKHDDGFVVQAVCHLLQRLKPKRMEVDQNLVKQIVEHLKSILTKSKEDFATRVWIAKALDALDPLPNDQLRVLAFKEQFEKEHLATIHTADHITIQTGLKQEEVLCLADEMHALERAYFARGAAWKSPVADDPNAKMTLIITATKDLYNEYMSAFIGFGAGAGGLYLERLSTLFTFQRTPEQSSYTLIELVLHEHVHYMNGRYLFTGFWGEAGDFKQPRGWIDEGLGELYGGYVFDDNGCYRRPIRRTYRTDVCLRQTNFDLQRLLERRAGHDQPGTFLYGDSWMFLYYLDRENRPLLNKIAAAFKDRTYDLSRFQELFGVSVASLQDGLRDKLAEWCQEPQQFDAETPECMIDGIKKIAACEKPDPSGFAGGDRCSAHATCDECLASDACWWCGGKCQSVSKVQRAQCDSACAVPQCATIDAALNKPATASANDKQASAVVSEDKPFEEFVKTTSSVVWFDGSTPDFDIYWQLDLGHSLPLKEIKIAANVLTSELVRVEASADGEQFTQLAEASGTRPREHQLFTIAINTTAKARFLRIRGANRGIYKVLVRLQETETGHCLNERTFSQVPFLVPTNTGAMQAGKEFGTEDKMLRPPEDEKLYEQIYNRQKNKQAKTGDCTVGWSGCDCLPNDECLDSADECRVVAKDSDDRLCIVADSANCGGALGCRCQSQDDCVAELLCVERGDISVCVASAQPPNPSSSASLPWSLSGIIIMFWALKL